VDAKTSLNVITTISKLAKRGRSVILTIHQPRSNIYKLFDQLLLLSRGKVAYFGPGNQVADYFEKLGFPLPINANPADSVMDLVADNPTATAKVKEIQEKKTIKILEHSMDKNSKLSLSQSDNLLHVDNIEHIRDHTHYRSTWITQYMVLTMRAFFNIIRDFKVTYAKFAQQIAMSLMVGLIFLRLSYDQNSVQNRVGALFFILLNQVTNSIMSPLTLFRDEAPLFFRERGAKIYSVSAYYLAKLTAELPHTIFFPVLFSCIAYWMVGLNESVDRFFMFLLIVVSIAICGQSIGILIAVVTPSYDMAMPLTSMITTLLLMFAGFYKNLDTLPSFLAWIYWLSVVSNKHYDENNFHSITMDTRQ